MGKRLLSQYRERVTTERLTIRQEHVKRRSVMGVQMEVRQQQDVMIRLVDGKVVKEARAANLYIVPPKGEYTFMVTGYAEPFQMKRDPQYMKEGDSEFQTMTRVEFTITEGKGAGKMFDQMWGFSIGERSNLGKFCRAMKIPLPQTGSWDLDSMLGYVGSGYVTPSDKVGDDGKPRYARLSIDTVEGISGPERPYSYSGEVQSAPPKSSTNGHAAGDDGWPEG